MPVMYIHRKNWLIHRKIIDFYENKDVKIGCYGDRPSFMEKVSSAIYFTYGPPGMPRSINRQDERVIAEYTCHNTMETIQYKYQNKWYSEQEMLKIIKLKAFM